MFILILFLSFLYYLFGNESNVKCLTTKGEIYIKVYENWAPIGSKRFLELVNDQFYTGK